jgi:hypothetical protein
VNLLARELAAAPGCCYGPAAALSLPTQPTRPRPAADTLAWKLELLREGGAAVEPLLPRIPQRAFVLVGDQDLLLPSGEEGPRLQRALPRAQLRVEKGRSHALLQVRRQPSSQRSRLCGTVWGWGGPCTGQAAPPCVPCWAQPPAPRQRPPLPAPSAGARPRCLCPAPAACCVAAGGRRGPGADPGGGGVLRAGATHVGPHQVRAGWLRVCKGVGGGQVVL